MPSAIVATPGAANANCYETQMEANAYFDDRLALSPAWPTSGDDGVRALLMATRTLDAHNRPLRIVFEQGGLQYYKTRRQWTGLPATAAQKLAWPRIGMFDGNGNPLDIGITSISVNPSAAVVTTSVPHRQITGATVFLFNTNSTPIADGAWVVTVLTPTTFSIPFATTVASTSGTMTFMPLELKEATSEFAGQLFAEDRTLDSDISKQKITALRAGSVALSFGAGVLPQVIPDAVLNIMPPSWFTDEIIEGAVSAEFSVVPNASGGPYGGGRW